MRRDPNKWLKDDKGRQFIWIWAAHTEYGVAMRRVSAVADSVEQRREVVRDAKGKNPRMRLYLDYEQLRAALKLPKSPDSIPRADDGKTLLWSKFAAKRYRVRETLIIQWASVSCVYLGRLVYSEIRKTGRAGAARLYVLESDLQEFVQLLPAHKKSFEDKEGRWILVEAAPKEYPGLAPSRVLLAAWEVAKKRKKVRRVRTGKKRPRLLPEARPRAFINVADLERELGTARPDEFVDDRIWLWIQTAAKRYDISSITLHAWCDPDRGCTWLGRPLQSQKRDAVGKLQRLFVLEEDLIEAIKRRGNHSGRWNQRDAATGRLRKNDAATIVVTANGEQNGHAANGAQNGHIPKVQGGTADKAANDGGNATATAANGAAREAGGANKPQWLKDRGELIFNGRVVKKVKHLAIARFVEILDTFEQQGWPDKIDWPFPKDDNPLRPHELVKSLNQRCDGVRFGCDGHGLGRITWRPS
jgi:hypothetical protein